MEPTHPSQPRISARSPVAADARGVGHLVGQLGLFLFGILVLYWAHQRSYLLFHSLAELFSVVIAASIFVLAWNTRRFQGHDFLTFLGVVFLSVGILDVLHLLTYKGMGVLPIDGANVSTQLWTAMRLVLSISLLIAPLAIDRRLNRWLLLGLYALGTGLLLASIFRWETFPTCFIEGVGLTRFKKNTEYLVGGALIAAMVFLWFRRSRLDGWILGLLLSAMAIAVLEGICFTMYTDTYGRWNWAGHILQIVCNYLIYQAIIVNGLERPYALLFRDFKQHEQELEQAKALAETASAAKDQFLAVLSHELRTPLTPVLTTVQMIEAQSGLPPDLRESITMIRRNIELETRLIDDLLDLTRLTHGKLQLQLTQVDLHQKLRYVLAICDSDIRAKGLALTVDLRAPRRFVRGDPARIQQVFWNLIKNAIKFTPEGGQITVRSTNAPEGSIHIEVIDTGIGIDEPSLLRLFDAFEQGHKDITRLFGGLGLGLTISKALVEQHGGTIAATSEGKGRGATFTVKLPTQPSIEPANVVDLRGALPPHPAGCRILLVEDHPDTARVMARLLGRSGYHVRVADSVAAALKASDGERFHLLISDIGLPDGSGLDLMRQLRQKCAIQGIALSGYGMEEDVRRSHEAGFAEHLTKPVNIERLQSTVARLVEQTSESSVQG